MKHKIGIDLDDCLADFIPVFRKISHDLFGKPEDLSTWPCDWNWSNFGLSLAERERIWDVIAQTHDFHRTLPVCTNTQLLPELNAKHELFFITARRPGAGEPASVQSAKWLEEHFGLDHPTVIVTMSPKWKLAEDLGLIAFLDDRAEAIEDMLGTIDYPVLMARPHNTFAPPFIDRVETFNEFAKRFLG